MAEIWPWVVGVAVWVAVARADSVTLDAIDRPLGEADSFPGLAAIGSSIMRGAKTAAKEAEHAAHLASQAAARVKEVGGKEAARAKAVAERTAAVAKAEATQAAAKVEAVASEGEVHVRRAAALALRKANSVASSGEAAAAGASDCFSKWLSELEKLSKASLNQVKLDLVACFRPAGGAAGGDGKLADWMQAESARIGDRRLSQVTLPGTHDSGAYKMHSEQVRKMPDGFAHLEKAANKLGMDHKPVVAAMLRQWATAQTRPVLGQLQLGIRYLDLRACYMDSSSGGGWVVHHGPVPGEPISAVLADASRFLNAHPGEVVMIEVSHMSGECSDGTVTPEQTAGLLKELKQSFGGMLVPAATGMQSTINELVHRGTRVVVAMPGVEDPVIFKSDLFVNDYANTDHVDKMVAHNTELVARLRSVANRTSLTKLSWTLTPTPDSVAKSIFACGSNADPDNTANGRAATSLVELAGVANSRFVSWSKQNGGVLPNVILFDDPTEAVIETTCKAPTATLEESRSDLVRLDRLLYETQRA